jgi:hypothetical protein
MRSAARHLNRPARSKKYQKRAIVEFLKIKMPEDGKLLPVPGWRYSDLPLLRRLCVPPIWLLPAVLPRSWPPMWRATRG